MSRLIQRAVRVRLSPSDETPIAFEDGQQSHTITQVMDCWRESGEWWNGEAPRQIWRMYTDKQAVFDLEQIDDSWSIYRVWD